MEFRDFQAKEREPIIKNVRRVVVKIGSKILSGKNLKLSRSRVKLLVGDINALISAGLDVVVVSSGAVLSGLEKLAIKGRPADLSAKQAAAAVGQGYLMQMYQNAFDAHKRRVAQVLLTRDDFRFCSRYTNAKRTIETLSKLGVVTIINENDAIATDEIKFGENDILSALVAGMVEADLLILLTDVDGFHAADPRRDRCAKLIPVVQLGYDRYIHLAGGPATSVGSGGMQSKVEAARTAAATGISSIVANGLTKNILQKIMSCQDTGTIFVTGLQKVSGRKHWLVFASYPQGTIVVDSRAQQVLMEGGDLMPEGVCSTSGSFRARDVVNLACVDGSVFARGVTNYSAQEIRWRKERGDLISNAQENKGYDEVVYRDKVVLLGQHHPSKSKTAELVNA